MVMNSWMNVFGYSNIFREANAEESAAEYKMLFLPQDLGKGEF